MEEFAPKTRGEKIREARNDLGYSQDDAALLLECSPAYISAIESDRKRENPSKNMIAKLNKLFNLDLEYTEREFMLNNKISKNSDINIDFVKQVDSINAIIKLCVDLRKDIYESKKILETRND